MKKRKNRPLELNEQPQLIKQDTSPIIPQRSKLRSSLDIYQRPLTEKQQAFLDLALDKQSKLIFVSGPAGTAKTYLSVQAALMMMSAKRLSDLIYVRSVVESAETKMGFLPGEVGDKLAPFLAPMMEKVEELLPKNQIDMLKKEERLTGFPVGHLRGRNWNAKVIIGDECISGNHFIQTMDGKIKLSSLYKLYSKKKLLPLVNTFNEKTRQFEFKNVKNVVNKGERKTVSVILGNRNIVCTPDHKFLTEKGWIEAKNLNPFTPIIGNNEIKLQTLDVLNDDQLQVFIGSFLGDGHIQKVGNNRYRLRVIHGAKQKDYCQWKSNLFHSNIEFIEKNGYSQKPAFRFTTKCFALPHPIEHDNKKTCPRWIIDSLDARGIAIWYMDDGYLNKSKNRIELSTCSFDLETQNMFVEKFKNIGIQCSIEKDEGSDYLYYSIVFNAENTQKFLDLVRPYIHGNLNYKINTLSETPYAFNSVFMGYRHIIPDKVIETGKMEVVYDIEVEDNHNFIITSGTRGTHLKSYSGVVVHNCQNMTEKELVTLITRTGEFAKVFIIGDPEQSDINGKSGFIKMISRFNDEECRKNGIHVFEFTDDDIVRSALVRFISKRLKKVV